MPIEEYRCLSLTINHLKGVEKEKKLAILRF